MILKIKNEFGVDAWFLKSGIEEIRYDHITKDEIEPPIDRHFDSKEKNINYVIMVINFVDGKKEIWITQVTTYLLNDEGKTVERIY